MGSFSIWHWVVVAVIVLVVFGGRGKISQLMGDFAQGIKAFKKGMSDDDKVATDEPAKLDPKTIEGTKPADPLKQHAQTERKFEGSTS
jgi:sec-independent protein translocase protein TatA